MTGITPKGKTYITTEPGEVVSTEQTVGHLVLSNGTRVQVKRAFVNAASATTTELIPAVAGAVFRVLSLFMLGGATAASVTFKSGSTTISPIFANAANGGAVLPPNLWGWFQTTAMNEALNVLVSTSSDVGVIVNFIEITDDLTDLL